MAADINAVRPAFGADKLQRPPVLETRTHRGPRAHEAFVIEAARDGFVGMGVDVFEPTVGIDAIDDRHVPVGIVDHGAWADRFRIDRGRIHVGFVGLLQIGPDAIAGGRDGVAHDVEKFVSRSGAGQQIAASGDLIAARRVANVVGGAARLDAGLVRKRQTALPCEIDAQYVRQLRAVGMKGHAVRIAGGEGIPDAVQTAVDGAALGIADRLDELAVGLFVRVGPMVVADHVTIGMRRRSALAGRGCDRQQRRSDGGPYTREQAHSSPSNALG